MNSKASLETFKTPEELIPSRAPDKNGTYSDSDVSKSFIKDARTQRRVAWDIETSGLDWRSQRIGLCQLWIPERELCLVKTRKNTIPSNLKSILEDYTVTKIFHHAMFDLRFLCYHWQVKPANIFCTKIAAKLLNPDEPNGHSLAALLDKHLSIKLDKSNRKSDWLSWELSAAQMEYAKADVVHLPRLMEVLEQQLRQRGLMDLASKCFAHIPTQVEIDICGYKDLFGY